MSDDSKIEWTDATWNPVTGCTNVSPGCDHCYAETFAERWRGTPGHHFERGFDVTLRPERMHQPLRWTRPRRIFVNSMSDVFHEDVPTEFIAELFAVMAACPQHIFQVLTKRHGRMRALLRGEQFAQDVNRAYATLPSDQPAIGYVWPLPNVWLGVSAEDQRWADIRIPALLQTPAAVRFVSAEPLLGPVSLHRYMPGWGHPTPTYLAANPSELAKHSSKPALDWVIVGGESGPGARHCDLTWLSELREQCDAEVPIFVKQLGSVLGREMGAGSKGGDWEAWPADLRVRALPATPEPKPPLPGRATGTCTHPGCTRALYGRGLDVCTDHVLDKFGISYQVLKTWVGKGYVRPNRVGSKTGSGTPHDWPAAELEIARRIASLTAVGLSAEWAASFIRSGAKRQAIAPGFFIERTGGANARKRKETADAGTGPDRGMGQPSTGTGAGGTGRDLVEVAEAEQAGTAPHPGGTGGGQAQGSGPAVSTRRAAVEVL